MRPPRDLQEMRQGTRSQPRPYILRFTSVTMLTMLRDLPRVPADRGRRLTRTTRWSCYCSIASVTPHRRSIFYSPLPLHAPHLRRCGWRTTELPHPRGGLMALQRARRRNCIFTAGRRSREVSGGDKETATRPAVVLAIVEEAPTAEEAVPAVVTPVVPPATRQSELPSARGRLPQQRRCLAVARRQRLPTHSVRQRIAMPRYRAPLPRVPLPLPSRPLSMVRRTGELAATAAVADRH